MIYVLRTADADPSFLKIGYSNRDILKRMKGIQTGCPYKLELVLYAKGSSRQEKVIHGNLRDFRVNGEWFRDTPESREIIESVFKKFNWKALDPSTVMSSRMSDAQKRANRYFKSCPTASWIIGEFCAGFRVKEIELQSLEKSKRAYSIEFLKWEDACSKYEFDGEKYDGEKEIISGPCTRGESAKIFFESVKKREYAPHPDDIVYYTESLAKYEKWARRQM